MQVESAIDGFISEAKAKAPAEAPATEVSDAVTETEQEPLESAEETAQADDGEQDDASGEVDELKTVRKALQKKNRYIDNLRARERALLEQIEKLKTGGGEAKPAPKEDDFNSVLDYLEAKNQHQLDTRIEDFKKSQQMAVLEEQQRLISEQRVQQNIAQYQELATANPDVKKMMDSPQIRQIVESLPDHVDALFDQVDNPVLAGYALAKEGRLADLAYMHPNVALVEIVQAMHRGQQYLRAKPQPQPVSKAPQPMAAVKGTGRPSKPLHQMSTDDIHKWITKP